MYYRTATQPAFKAHFAALARYSREIWLAFQLPGLTEDQLEQSELAHVWRAYRRADESREHYGKAAYTIQALVTSLRYFQWRLTEPWIIDAEAGSPFPMLERLHLREGRTAQTAGALCRHTLRAHTRQHAQCKTDGQEPADAEYELSIRAENSCGIPK